MRAILTHETTRAAQQPARRAAFLRDIVAVPRPFVEFVPPDNGKTRPNGQLMNWNAAAPLQRVPVVSSPTAIMIATFGEGKMTLPPGGPGRGMLLASIGFRVQPHKRSEALSAVDETVRRMRITSGCARSRLLEDADDPNAFMLLSEWHSVATADLFFNSRDFQIFKGIRILLREEPVIVLDEVQSRMVRLLRSP